MAYTLQDIYKEYTNTVSLIDKKIFRDICEEFNMARKERDPRNPKVDWGESNKYKQELLEQGKKLYNAETGEGVKWHIYYTDGYYCKFYWRKGKCRIPNKSVYRFDATRGIKGNKEKLINLLKTDDLAYLKFKKE